MKMLTEHMQDAINTQIGHELDNAHIYLQMANWLDVKGWPGMASYFRVQAAEERDHAQIFQEYMCDRLALPQVPSVPAPQPEFASLPEVFQAALDREHLTTDNIYQLFQQAVDDRDFQTQTELEWFLDEQVEEVKSAHVIVQQLTARGGEVASYLKQLDEQLGERQYIKAAPLK